MPNTVTARIKALKRAALRKHRSVDPADRIFVPVAPVRVRPAHHRTVVGPDTRDLTGRIMGDPLPGRSALDLRSTQ